VDTATFFSSCSVSHIENPLIPLLFLRIAFLPRYARCEINSGYPSYLASPRCQGPLLSSFFSMSDSHDHGDFSHFPVNLVGVRIYLHDFEDVEGCPGFFRVIPVSFPHFGNLGVPSYFVSPLIMRIVYRTYCRLFRSSQYRTTPLFPPLPPLLTTILLSDPQ